MNKYMNEWVIQDKMILILWSIYLPKSAVSASVWVMCIDTASNSIFFLESAKPNSASGPEKAWAGAVREEILSKKQEFV